MAGSVMSPESILMGDVFQGESGIKFEPTENNHHVCNKVQEILPDNIKGESMKYFSYQKSDYFSHL